MWLLLKRYKMAKLQSLHEYLTERLMAAAVEIFKAVEETILEYQEENARTRTENDDLRKKLTEVQIRADEIIQESARPVPVSVEEASIEQYSEHEWCFSLKQDTEPPQTEVKQELTEPHKSRQASHEYRGLEPETSGSIPLHMRNDCDQDSLQPTLKFKMPIVDNDDGKSLPNTMSDHVKTEPDEMDCSISDQPTNSLSLNTVYRGSDTTQSGKNVSVKSIESLKLVLYNEAEKSKGKFSMVKGQCSVFCTQCGRTFWQFSQLRVHMRIHEEGKPFCCCSCGKSFNHSEHLKTHQLIHKGKKPYCCTVCGKSFGFPGKLNEHQRIHTGERPYCCTVCGKCFSRSFHLKVHMRVHTGEKPYRCTLCGRCFSQSNQIKRHLCIHSN